MDPVIRSFSASHTGSGAGMADIVGQRRASRSAWTEALNPVDVEMVEAMPVRWLHGTLDRGMKRSSSAQSTLSASGAWTASIGAVEEVA